MNVTSKRRVREERDGVKRGRREREGKQVYVCVCVGGKVTGND